jgi:hypothetical protein
MAPDGAGNRGVDAGVIARDSAAACGMIIDDESSCERERRGGGGSGARPSNRALASAG